MRIGYQLKRGTGKAAQTQKNPLITQNKIAFLDFIPPILLIRELLEKAPAKGPVIEQKEYQNVT